MTRAFFFPYTRRFMEIAYRNSSRTWIILPIILYLLILRFSSVRAEVTHHVWLSVYSSVAEQSNPVTFGQESVTNHIFDTVASHYLLKQNLELGGSQVFMGVVASLYDLGIRSEMVRESILAKVRVVINILFDPQPIGGILSIRADLIPLYSGIGIGNRPIATESFASAVETLDSVYTQSQIVFLVRRLDQRSRNALKDFKKSLHKNL
jgi:hypothetical protein